MKLSVSMDTDDVDFIDQYATEHAVGSRSAVMQKAVALLRAVELGDDYADAWDEWARTDDADLWDATVNDGLDK
ncbi:MAG TPA: antitoxin [Acidimicrobiales bacterium]|nr:antitoxin [Acidimicrobiales bacterium]